MIFLTILPTESLSRSAFGLYGISGESLGSKDKRLSPLRFLCSKEVFVNVFLVHSFHTAHATATTCHGGSLIFLGNVGYQ